MVRKYLVVMFSTAVFLVLQLSLKAEPRSRHESRMDRVTVQEGTTLRASLESTLSTKTARPGDRFTLKVREPIYVTGVEAIPYGAEIEGRVTEVKRPGHIHGVGKLDIAYDQIILPDGDKESLIASTVGVESGQTKTKVNQEGQIAGPSSRKRDVEETAAGGGIGAGIGALAGGAKGTAIGGGAGALIGLADTMRRRGKDLELPRGTPLVIRLDRPLTVEASESH